MLNTLPPAYIDVNEVGREVRIQTIAEATAQAVGLASCLGPYEKTTCEKIWNDSPQDLAALIVTKGWWESRFSKNVHEGKCKPYECDPVTIRQTGKIMHLARTPWQFQRTAFSEPFWEKMVGTDLDSTRYAAYTAAVILSRGKNACKSNQGAIIWYARGRCTSASRHLVNRFHTFQRMQQLYKTSQELDS